MEKIKYQATVLKEKHHQNPFMEEKYPIVQIKTKRITNNRGGYMVKSTTGETVSPIAGFWHAEEVDSTKFVKLYINGVKAFSDLSRAGTKVFEFLYMEIQNNIGKDKIYLNFSSIDQNLVKIGKATFYRGLEELVEKKFLAASNSVGWFWLNPDYIWNGDRLSFVKTYIKKEDSKILKRDDKTLDLFNDGEPH
jgi:hypothetical protein